MSKTLLELISPLQITFHAKSGMHLIILSHIKWKMNSFSTSWYSKNALFKLILIKNDLCSTDQCLDSSYSLRMLLYFFFSCSIMFKSWISWNVLFYGYQLVGHLVYWGKATIIYPVCSTNLYVLSPHAPTVMWVLFPFRKGIIYRNVSISGFVIYFTVLQEGGII